MEELKAYSITVETTTTVGSKRNVKIDSDRTTFIQWAESAEQVSDALLDYTTSADYYPAETRIVDTVAFKVPAKGRISITNVLYCDGVMDNTAWHDININFYCAGPFPKKNTAIKQGNSGKHKFTIQRT